MRSAARLVVCSFKAEIYNWKDWKENDCSEATVKEKGKYRQEGKNYVVKDKDIILFKVRLPIAPAPAPSRCHPRGWQTSRLTLRCSFPATAVQRHGGQEEVRHLGGQAAA